MNAHRWITVLLTGTILASVGQAQTLVPGDPPLTQDMVDKDIAHWELILDIRLTPAERRQYEQTRLDDWKVGAKSWKDGYLKDHAIRVKNAALSAAERGQIRDKNQRRTLAQLRAAPHDLISRILLTAYEGRTLDSNAPPLTRGTFDRHVAFYEWLLDLRLSVAQRKEYQLCLIAEWKKATKEARTEFIRKTESDYGNLGKSSLAQRAAVRAVRQPATLKEFRASMDEDDKLLLAAYEVAHKPGSAWNPILAEGDPPLTRDLVHRFADYLQFMIARTSMGGWSKERLEAMKRLITADWQKKDGAGKDAFLADVTWWQETFPKLSLDQRTAAGAKRISAYLKHVEKTAGESAERRQWVADIAEDARLEVKIVPGDPPLTRGMVDRDIDYWELVLDIRLTPAQRKQVEQMRVIDWKGPDKAWKENYVKSHKRFRVGIPRLDEAARLRIRTEEQQGTLAQMRALATDDLYRLLLPIYESQLIAPGDPPLTRGDFDKLVACREWLLDINLTMPQRRELQGLVCQNWPRTAKTKREGILKFDREIQGKLDQAYPAARVLIRIQYQTSFLKTIRAPSSKSSQWLLAAYEAARKPGSARNPILAEGDPLLTQDLVNQYADYLEYMIARPRMGGWPQERLDTMKRLITTDWQKKDGWGKAAFLADVNWWTETFPKLNADQRHEAKTTKLSAYRAHVEKTAAAGEERRRWIAGIAEDDRLEVELLQKKIIASEQMKRDAMLRAQIEQSRHETQMFIISTISGNAGPTPGYGYGYFLNPRTYQQEFRFGWK